MPGKVDGDRIDLEVACDFDWQWSPGIEVRAGIVQQERDIWSIAPAKSAQHLPPRQIPLDRLRARKCLGAYVPHSLCL
jgi:hypothetical protein